MVLWTSRFSGVPRSMPTSPSTGIIRSELLELLLRVPDLADPDLAVPRAIPLEGLVDPSRYRLVSRGIGTLGPTGGLSPGSTP
jgi:hypothetical protein